MSWYIYVALDRLDELKKISNDSLQSKTLLVWPFDANSVIIEYDFVALVCGLHKKASIVELLVNARVVEVDKARALLKLRVNEIVEQFKLDVRQKKDVVHALHSHQPSPTTTPVKEKNPASVDNEIDELSSRLAAVQVEEVEDELSSLLGKKAYKVTTGAKPLATGAFGVVLAAFHQNFGDVAIKCLTVKEDNDRVLREEVKIQQSLLHDNIVKIFDYFYSPSHFCIVMERFTCDFHLIWSRHCTKRQRFNRETLKRMACDVAKGMAFIHDSNIVHRDLKPENILVQVEGDEEEKTCLQKFAIADFGSSTHIKKPEANRFHCTPQYMSPEAEKLLCFPEDVNVNVGLETDVWSFGVILLNSVRLCWLSNKAQAKLRDSGFRIEDFAGAADDKGFIDTLYYEEVVALIAKCLQVDRSKRPKFSEIAQIVR